MILHDDLHGVALVGPDGQAQDDLVVQRHRVEQDVARALGTVVAVGLLDHRQLLGLVLVQLRQLSGGQLLVDQMIGLIVHVHLGSRAVVQHVGSQDALLDLVVGGDQSAAQVVADVGASGRAHVNLTGGVLGVDPGFDDHAHLLGEDVLEVHLPGGVVLAQGLGLTVAVGVDQVAVGGVLDDLDPLLRVVGQSGLLRAEGDDHVGADGDGAEDPELGGLDGLHGAGGGQYEMKDIIRNKFSELIKPYDEVVVIANSIGAFYTYEYLYDFNIKQAFFISPVANMFQIIFNLMINNGITRERLKEERFIRIDSKTTLSYEFYQYLSDNLHNQNFKVPTEVLYGSKDELVYIEDINNFIMDHDARLTIKKGSKHYFHSEEEKEFIKHWILNNLKEK